MEEKTAVGIIGLGNMGGAMTLRLRDAGESVVGYDVRADRATALELPEIGSVAQICDAAGVILLSLPDSPVVESVVLSPDGLRDHLRAGRIVVDLSTSSPDSTREIAKALGAKGVGYLDAGVSGGPRGARSGELTLMVGGEEADLRAVTPVLNKIAKEIYHLGASGAGHTAKVLNNFLNAVNLAATSEAFIAAKRAGLDLQQFLAAVNKSSGVSNATLKRFPSILSGDYREGNLSMKLMMKDLQLFLEVSRSLGVPTLMAPGCLGLFGAAIAMGRGTAVNNRIVDVVGDLSGGVRLLD